MTFQLFVSFLTMLLFLAAILAPFIYTLYKQKQDKKENARRQAAVDRGEGEVEKLDLSSGGSREESYHRYSGERGYRVENRPSRVDGAGREVYSTPYSAAPAQKRGNGAREGNGPQEEKSESLSAHTKEFSSHALSSSLDERYNGWDEMSRAADSWNKPSAPFGEKAAPSAGKYTSQSAGAYRTGGSSAAGGRSSSTGSTTAASSAQKSGKRSGTGFRRIRSLPELKRALVMSQILGPPKTLELEDHPGYGKYR